MKCSICEKEFISLEWYKEGIRDLVICDDCLLDVLKAKRYNMKSELDFLDRHINDLQLKIE